MSLSQPKLYAQLHVTTVAGGKADYELRQGTVIAVTGSTIVINGIMSGDGPQGGGTVSGCISFLP